MINIQTYFTNRIGTSELLFSAQEWTTMVLRLETAGPVAVSTKQEIVPVLSGKGVLLPVNDDYRVTLAPGDRLFIAAENTNRVSYTTQPVPWAEAIVLTLRHGFDALARTLLRR